ncbi:serine/threonine protein kinase [filamentous cyanobacterium CCP2]|nr:serine/threonine protein kinase [filamentous cyanobacterium CCP2]
MNSNNCVNGHSNPENANFCYVCGQPLRGQTTGANLTPGLQPGTRLRDRYTVRQELGQGGFGRTYLVEDAGRFNDRMVVKEFFPSLQGTAALQKAVELFQQEARTLYQLQHPQIPRFWEIFQDSSRLFLVEDFVEGQTYADLLTERVRFGRCFTEPEITKFLRDLLPVLGYLHRQGVIHRDIAPDNIILDARSGLPVLIDLGAAKQAAINATTVNPNLHRGTSIGKTGYAPDEQIRLGIVAPYSDLYALAVTAIVLMTGKQPPDLLDQRTLQWQWGRDIQVSPHLTQILNTMLAPRPDQRFQSADEVLQALDPAPRFNVPSPVPTPIPAVTPSPARPSQYDPPPTVIGSAPNVNADFAPRYAVSVNNSGHGKLFDNSEPIPPEIRGWNWGAFLLPGIWVLINQVWIGLIVWIPYVGFIMQFVLGAKGNEWAWKSRRWESVEAFKRHQRRWTIAGLIVWGLLFLFGFLAGLSG